MIKCRDVNGQPVEGTFRTLGSNALIFEPGEKHNDYMRELEMRKKISDLEDKVNRLMEFINSTPLNNPNRKDLWQI